MVADARRISAVHHRNCHHHHHCPQHPHHYHHHHQYHHHHHHHHHHCVHQHQQLNLHPLHHHTCHNSATAAQLPDATPTPPPNSSTGTDLNQSFTLPVLLQQNEVACAEPEELGDEDDEYMFVMTDEWKEFFAKSDARRKLEKQEAINIRKSKT